MTERTLAATTSMASSPRPQSDGQSETTSISSQVIFKKNIDLTFNVYYS